MPTANSDFACERHTPAKRERLYLMSQSRARCRIQRLAADDRRLPGQILHRLQRGQ